MSSDQSVSSLPVMPAPRRKPWVGFVILLTLCCALASLDAYVWLAFSARPLPPGGDLEAPTELSFDDTSDKLKETIFLPTLERPIPDGKSAIWCATAPMAWQELEKAVKKPVDVMGAAEICRELRETPDAKLEPDHYYVAAGRTDDDSIVERIGRELPLKFPNAPPIPAVTPEGTLAVAYLEVAIFYDYLFKHSAEPLSFKDGRGRITPVHAFGIRKEDVGGHSEETMRGQVLVLFRNNGEFALDLSHNTKPYQIILARMARQPSLKETLAELDKRTAAAEPKHLNHAAIMLVPSMHWKATHRFTELEGRYVNDPKGRSVEMVYQSTHFKMDRKGAYVASAVVVTLPDNGHPEEPPNPDHYFFDRSFLVVMKRRGGNQPFFVMWVDNAELLQSH
jgi:hypothetical protein